MKDVWPNGVSAVNKEKPKQERARTLRGLSDPRLSRQEIEIARIK